MATTTVPQRTPSSTVRIRSRSIDSPPSRVSITPVQEWPYSRSTNSVATKAFGIQKTVEYGGCRSSGTSLDLHTRSSDESIVSDAPSTPSLAMSPHAESVSNKDIRAGSHSSVESERPHPLASAQTTQYNKAEVEPYSSPFLYQDTSYPMSSPWLVKAVLDLSDVRGLDWMSMAEPVQRIWGVQTSAAEVLDILSNNGRVGNRQWWD